MLIRYFAPAVLCGLMTCVAATTNAATTPELPDGQDAWVNSSPISLSLLEGKAALLWFYEET